MQQKFVSLFNSLVFAGRFGHEQGSLLEYKENSDYSQYFEQHLSRYDEFHQLVEINYENFNFIGYEYDEAGNLIHLNSGAFSYELTANSAGTGAGTITSDDGKIDCVSDCSDIYIGGSEITLFATPYKGSTFSGWSGGGV